MTRPELTVILPADSSEGIRETLRCLRAQADRDRLELVIVTPSRDALALADAELEGFVRPRVVETGPVERLSELLAAGVREASAEVVAMAEGHSYPEPGWAAALLAGHRDGWDAVGPAMACANPDSAIGWADLLITFGRWVEPHAAGSVDALPAHNTSYRRDALLAYEPHLAEMLEVEILLHWDLRSKGQRLYLEPAARTRHLNIALAAPWLRTRFAGGRLFAANRRRSWSALHRLLYALAGAPIVAVRLWRLRRDVLRVHRRHRLPLRVLPALVLGIAAEIAGETAGYAVGARGVLRPLDVELNRHRYVRSSPPAPVAAAPATAAEDAAAASRPAGPAPELSVVMPADSYATIRHVLRSYRAQTACARLELVIVVPAAEGFELPAAAAAGFCGVRVVPAGSPSVPHARAYGVRVAAAPVVLLAETHAFPEAGFAEALIAAHRGPWAVVGPAMCNANPRSAISWSNLLMDYGPWVNSRQRGTMDDVPANNGSYKRDVLLEYGASLDRMLESWQVLNADLHARGHELFLESAARTYHLNVSRPCGWPRERVAAGRLFAAMRSRSWPWHRRLLYVAAAPLIPAVRLRRVVPYARASRDPGERRPRLLLPVLAIGLVFSAIGELLGYAFGPGGAAVIVERDELDRTLNLRPSDLEQLRVELAQEQ